MEPSVIPLEVLEAWGNYNKPKFNLGKFISYLFLLALILLPLMFFKPAIVAERTNVDSSASNALYDIHIRTLLPIRTVSATLDGNPVSLQQTESREYSAEVTENGSLTIKVVAFNGQISSRTYTVSHLDTEKPAFFDSYSEDGLIYLVVRDTYSGINYDGITGLTPESYDTDKGTIAFKVPETAVTITIPDNAGNELMLLLSPVDGGGE